MHTRAVVAVLVLALAVALGTAGAQQQGKIELLWLGQSAWKNPATGKDETHVGGEPAGFVIELENGFKIYHMGDTGSSATCAGSVSTTSPT